MNVASILGQQLHPAQLRLLRDAATAAVSHGAQLYLVGGTVRDVLLGRRPADLDLSVVGPSAEGFAAALARELDGEVLAYSQFGTAKLRLGDTVVDLVAARKETYARPGALPAVAPGALQDDLARRDFTIHAMAISLSYDSWGGLLDPFDGQQDLRQGLLKVLHPASFADDATRALRAVRYARRLQFSLEPATEILLRRDLAYLDSIKGDRVRHELERIFREEQAVPILEMAQHLGILSAIYPGLRVETEALARLQQSGPALGDDQALVILSLLACSVASENLPGFIGRLSMDARWARTVRDTGAVRELSDRLRVQRLRPSQLYRLLSPFDVAAVRGCSLATGEQLVAGRLEQYLAELRHLRPYLNGDDLISLGVSEGPEVGRLLDELRTAKLDGLLSTRQDEERFVAQRLKQHGS